MTHSFFFWSVFVNIVDISRFLCYRYNGSQMWKEVYQTYFDLPDDEKEMFLQAIERDKIGNSSDMAKLISNLRETCFAKDSGAFILVQQR